VRAAAEAQVSVGIRGGRVAAALAVAACFTLPTSNARAQGVDEFGAYGGREKAGRSESPQNAAFEFRFGRYQPEVDSDLGGTPFHDVFGDKPRFLLGAEVDWQLMRVPHLGSIGPGLGWGLTRFQGKARVTATGELSAADTRIWMMPTYVAAVLRADVFMRDFAIPVVPYAKLGVGYALWWSSDGQKTAMSGDTVGRGASYGLTYALGGMFLLDCLDREDAAMADGLSGINNSYVFAEWFRPQLDGFGSNKVMNLSSSSWVLGVAIEM
jgi:hypothetical protein